VAQLFILARSPPWQDSQRNWTVLVTAGENGVFHQVSSQLHTLNYVNHSSNKPQIYPYVFLLVFPFGSPNVARRFQGHFHETKHI
jgi:hypothetical protein